MGGGPIIIIDPKRKVLRFMPDAKVWHRKWSTWLAMTSASATGGLGAYAILPARAQELVPDWALMSLGGVAIMAALLVPLATSLSQEGLKDRL